jgi:hypothetical protein
MPKSILAALAAVLACLALSAPAAAAPGDAERLSLAHDLLGAIPLNDVFDKEIGPVGKMFGDIDRPEWAGLFKAAAHEEIEADLPQIEQVIGRLLFGDYTADELQAGVRLFNGPARGFLLQGMNAAATGQAWPATPPSVQAELQKIMRDPAGRRFLEKLAKADSASAGEKFGHELAPMILPGIFRRFGEKAELAERARRGSTTP